MSLFTNRSYEEELMDDPHPDRDELYTNLNEIITINKLTGGPAQSYPAIKSLIRPSQATLHFADIGCGGGDMLAYMAKKYENSATQLILTGIDFQEKTIDFAHQKYPWLKDRVNWIVADYESVLNMGFTADIFHAGLFCHHLKDDAIERLFTILKSSAEQGFVINDLQRSPLAYYGIKTLNQLFSRSRFTKNDAPLSVLRGFKRNELEKWLINSGIGKYTIEWKWAFRYLIKVPTDGK